MPPAHWRDELVLWLPAVVILVVVSSQVGFSHHMRYVLPMFPLVIIATGKLAYYLRPQRWRTGLVVGLLLLATGGSSLAVHPHYLSYFNEAAGGPDNGHKHLLDSNIDWGQDLLFLRDWLERHPEARPLHLAYFNQIDPGIVGIDYTLPPPGPTGLFQNDEAYGATLGPHPGYFAVSVNLLHGMSGLTPDGAGGLRAASPETYQYFREFNPIAKAGYSIFIYHITLDEANAVRQRLGLPLLKAGGGPPPRVAQPAPAGS
jgi:hypothetical protein